MTASNVHNIRVHAWIAGVETPYVGDGHDVTSWIETLDDERLCAAAYTFEQSLVREYEPQLVTLVSQLERRVTVYMDLDEYEVAAYIRFNRPAVRDRLNLCVCTARVGGNPDGLPCLCDGTFDEPGQMCHSCEQGDHNYQGRS